MALNALGLGFVFTAQDLASGKINHIARSFGNMDAAAIRSSASMQRNFAQLGAGALVLGGGMTALMGGFRLAGIAGEFSREVARVGQVANASADDLVRLHDEAIRIGATTGFAPTEAMQGLGELAQAGLNAQQSIQALAGALDLAAGGQIEVSSSAAAISSALKTFGRDASDAGIVADMFLRITNSTALAAGDMEQAMGSVARGAISAHQQLEEMLPAIGLVKNTGVDVTVAAQSVSSALVFMSSRAEQFKAIGVDITDQATGEFRDFLDIVLETSHELDTRYPNAAERAAAATDLFSRFGLQAYAGISQQLATGVRDSAGNLYQGAAAIEYLRGQMQNATGTAAAFRDALMDTFEGRKAELAAATQTLGVILGEGFEVAWKPVVEFLRDGVRQLVAFFQELPVSVRGNIATFITWAGAAATLFGTFIAGKAILALLAPFIGSLTTAFAGLLATLAPVALAFGAIAAVGYTVYRHFFATEAGALSLARAINQVKLGFSGLMQLIGTGALSGEVLADLNRVENSGVKRFIANIYSFGFRIMQFFRGIGIGFNAAVDAMGPTLERAGTAFSRLWGYVSMIFGGAGSSLVAGGSARYISAGAAIGDFFADLVEVLVVVGTHVATFITGFIGGFRRVWTNLSPIINFTVEQLGLLWDSIVDVGRALGIVTESVGGAGGGVERFGNGLGGIVAGSLSIFIGMLGGAARMLRLIVDIASWAVGKISAVLGVFFDLGSAIVQAFMNVKLAILDVVDSGIVKMGELMAAIPAGMRPAMADQAIVAGITAQGRISGRAVERVRIDTAARSVRRDGIMGGPAGAEARANASNATAQVQAASATAMLLARQARERAAPANQTINVIVDGQVVAQANAAATANNNERSFTPTGGARDD